MHILFDSGQSSVILDNARSLGAPLEKADYIVISHGHYDHTGGLAHVLPLARKAKIILHPHAVVTRYSIRPDSAPVSIGMPPSAQQALNGIPVEYVEWSSEPVRLSPHVETTGAIPRIVSYENSSGPFFTDIDGKIEDGFSDDQALWISTTEGLIVCAGCCHAGLINTLKQAQRASDMTLFRAVIGGFHLGQAADERISRTLVALEEFSPALLVPCHCTGDRAARKFQQALPDRFSPCGSGRQFMFVAKE
jgi:7,8-dihydropterin-6-yl-methyl-4-(beta-D-ribofuranosyl)aminobenzene 5'-phosphate synthase